MTLEELREQLQENLLCLTDEYLIDELDGYEGFDDEMCQIVADTVNKFIEVNNNNYQVIAEKFGEARESSYIYRVNKEINMKKIRVNTGNSKVINGKLFITLFKAGQLNIQVHILGLQNEELNQFDILVLIALLARKGLWWRK